MVVNGTNGGPSQTEEGGQKGLGENQNPLIKDRTTKAQYAQRVAELTAEQEAKTSEISDLQERLAAKNNDISQRIEEAGKARESLCKAQMKSNVVLWASVVMGVAGMLTLLDAKNDNEDLQEELYGKQNRISELTGNGRFENPQVAAEYLSQKEANGEIIINEELGIIIVESQTPGKPSMELKQNSDGSFNYYFIPKGIPAKDNQ